MINFIFIFCIGIIQLSTAQVVSYLPRNAQQANIQINQNKNSPNNNLNQVLSNPQGPYLTQTQNIQPLSINNGQYYTLPNSQVNGQFAHAHNPNVAANARLTNTHNLNANIDIANARMANVEIANAANSKLSHIQNANVNNPSQRMAEAQITANANGKFTHPQNHEIDIAKARVTNAPHIKTKFAHGHNTNIDANARMANTQNANAEMNKIALIEANKRNDQIAKTDLANSYINAQNELNARMQANAYWNKERNLDMSKLDNNAISNLVNVNLANANLATANLDKANSPSLWALSNLASMNGNMATFKIGNGDQTFTITSGSPASPPFGIQLLAEALEVGGTVSVSGQIPIYGTVAVNGNVPTDGTAAVKYSSARKAEA